jgi:uncharacterized protein YggU (UPF0235/DUF167 family)
MRRRPNYQRTFHNRNTLGFWELGIGWTRYHVPVPPFTDTPAGASLTVRVTPRAGRTRVTGLSATQLLVRIAAAPVDSAANEALIEILADTVRVPKRAIRITSGERSRTKRLTFAGYAAVELDQRLAAALPAR